MYSYLSDYIITHLYTHVKCTKRMKYAHKLCVYCHIDIHPKRVYNIYSESNQNSFTNNQTEVHTMSAIEMKNRICQLKELEALIREAQEEAEAIRRGIKKLKNDIKK